MRPSVALSLQTHPRWVLPVIAGGAIAVGVAVAAGHWALLAVLVVLLGVLWVMARAVARVAGDHGRALVGLVGVAGGLLLLNAYAPAHPPGVTRLLAASVILAGLLPALWWVWTGGGRLPFLAAIGGLYALYYGAPVFLREQMTVANYVTTQIPVAEVNRSLWLTLLGMGCLYLGWAVARSPWRLDLRRSALLNDRTAAALAVVGLVVYTYELRHPGAASVAQYIGLLASLTLLGLAVLYVRWATRASSSRWLLPVFATVLVVRVLLGFGTGANFQSFEVFMPILLLASLVRGRLPWKAVLFGLLALAVLQPVKALYRSELQTAPASSSAASPFTAAARYVSTADQFLHSGPTPRQTVDEFMSRFGAVYMLATVTELTPSQVPYWGAGTLTPLLSTPIPRALWPSKPQEVTGQTFGHRYGFLLPQDMSTSWNMPQLIEFYADFGTWGVVVGMLLLGAIYRLLFETLGGATRDPQLAVGAAYVLSALLLIESGTALVLAGALYQLAFLIVLVQVMGRRAARATSSVAV